MNLGKILIILAVVFALFGILYLNDTHIENSGKSSGETTCIEQFGEYAINKGFDKKTGKTICDCKEGYVNNIVINKCEIISDELLNANCEMNYGSGGFSLGLNKNTIQNNCGCKEGYTMKGKKCKKMSKNELDALCIGEYGENSFSEKIDKKAGENICSCKKGYILDEDIKNCVKIEQDVVEKICKNKNGTGIIGTITIDGEPNCICTAGYTLDENLQKCVEKK